MSSNLESSTGVNDSGASKPEDNIVVETRVVTSRGWNWRADARAAVIATVIVMVGIGGLYAHMRQSPIVRFGLVDIAEVVEIEQLRVTSQVLKPELTAAQKDVYFKQASGFGARLEEAIVALKRDCECELLARSAYVGAGATDLTEALKARMGLAGMQLEHMRAVGQAAVMARLPTPSQQAPAALPPGIRP